MKKNNIEKKEIFSLLTSKQINEINDLAVIKVFNEEEIIYDQKEQAKNLFIILEGEVVLKLPSGNEMSHNTFTIQIDRLKDPGIFGVDLLFGIKRYVTRARATKPSKIMILDSSSFMKIIKENKSELIIMTYLAKVYFQRYINAMKAFQQCVLQKSIPEV